MVDNRGMCSRSMINEEIRELIQECIGSELVSDLEDIRDDDELFIVGIDSINLVTLILEIENKYGIEFDVEEIDMEKFKTINDIAKIVSMQLE